MELYTFCGWNQYDLVYHYFIYLFSYTLVFSEFIFNALCQQWDNEKLKTFLTMVLNDFFSGLQEVKKLHSKVSSNQYFVLIIRDEKILINNWEYGNYEYLDTKILPKMELEF